jgi:hypothetical protein
VKAEVVAQGCVVELKAAPGEAAVVIRELSGTSGTLGMLQVRGVMLPRSHWPTMPGSPG